MKPRFSERCITGGTRATGYWAELNVTALRGGSRAELDYTHDITDSKSFAPELRAIHARRDESCRDWLQAHAFNPAKCLLAKMCHHRLSGRRCSWQNSMFKFDHSKRGRLKLIEMEASVLF